MKCPKCGYVSHPDLLQCKKCGRSLIPAPEEKGPSFISSLLSPAPRKTPVAANPSPVPGEPSAPVGLEKFISPPQSKPEQVPVPPVRKSGGLTASAYPHSQATPPMWRDELTGRVQKFRRKRARLQTGFDPSSTLDLEFDAEEDDATEDLAALIGGQVVEFGDQEREFTHSSERAADELSGIDSAPPPPQENGPRDLGGAAVQVGETLLGYQNLRPEPVEIFLDSRLTPGREIPSPAYPSRHLQGLMSDRFKAGLVDGAVLLAGGGIFAGIFFAVGPKAARISPSPANLVALATLATAMVILYFGVSVAYSSATPGLAWMGLEVRNLDGDFPTARESWWRAFGYLISASALFLGFVWALLDNDGLTWHDLMSGTCVVERDS